MSKRQRSVFWIVSTHVLTTGLAMPVIAGLAATFVIHFAGIGDPRIALYVQATFAVAGYVGGALYSLSYLRKTAECESWTNCTAPAIVTFAVLDILGCAWAVYELAPRTPASIAILVASYLVGLFAAAVITASGFAGMSSPTGAPREDSQSEESPVASNRFASKSTRRFLGACLGFAAGGAVGIGISISMGQGRAATPDVWQTRLLTALVVGSIGALLGLVSGPPQK
jgi:hypothetical protein